jgi:hypothetical protein
MAQLNVTVLAMVSSPPEQVRSAIADYLHVRPAILTTHFTDYEVIEGGHGAGTTVRWTMNPARWGRRQARAWLVRVDEIDGVLTESDTHSSTVTTWTVTPAADDRSAVRVQLTWDIPAGIMGALARFRSANLRKIYGQVAFRLREYFQAGSGAINS